LIVIFNKYADKRRERKLNIQRWQEEIDDYRGWNADEAIFRIIGNIKRLNSHNITKINLSYCYLENACLGSNPQRFADRALGNLSPKDMGLMNQGYLVRSVATGDEEFIANLHGAILINTNLIKANLMDVNLSDANLYRADLQEACLHYADLQGTNLRSANLQCAFLQAQK